MTYIDDILIYSTSYKQHTDYLNTVFNIIKNNSLSINNNKSQIFKKTVDYFRFTIENGGYHPMKSHVEAIQKISRPNSIKRVQSF